MLRAHGMWAPQMLTFVRQGIVVEKGLEFMASGFYLGFDVRVKTGFGSILNVHG